MTSLPTGSSQPLASTAPNIDATVDPTIAETSFAVAMHQKADSSAQTSTSRLNELPIASVSPPPRKETLIVTGLSIIVFSIVGAVIRIGLNELNNYPQAPVFYLAWAQVIGCFLFGLFQAHKADIVRISPSLYVGLTTGLCGTITTFSAFMINLFEYLVGSPTFTPSTSNFTVHNILSPIALFTITIGMAISALRFGATVAPTKMRLPHGQILSDTIEWILGISGLISYIAIIIATSIVRDEYSLQWILACLLAPLGALIRWQLSLRLNPFYGAKFPLGTFTANVVGTVIRAWSQMVLVRGVSGSFGVAFWAGGVNDGFTGGLTTLSTLANELDGVGMSVAGAAWYLGWTCFWAGMGESALAFPFSK
ncbi:hypothetical protein HDU79_002272 [Rhizoclosmatium sp. JEL0117]|nr:hypothetical protein HDU79_002272 [Rhizoclosmatium sp. JEL0117]